MSDQSLVGYEVRDRVAVLTMQRGPVNAVNFALIDAIHAGLRRADADPEVGAIVLTSAFEKVFSGGMDLDMVLAGGSLEVRAFINKFYLDTLDIQYGLSKPTIAAVNGAARGAGVTLSITCDMIVGAEEADLGYPEIKIGVIPAIHFVHLPRQISRHTAFELLFSGDPIGFREAAALGIVNHAVPRAQVLAKAMELGRKMAAMSPTVMRLGRNSFMRANDLDYRRNIANQVETFCNIMETPDAREGMRAFKERRSPRWQR